VTPETAAWIRDNAWPQRIAIHLGGARPTAWGNCSCEMRICPTCTDGLHGLCFTPDNKPAHDQIAGVVSSSAHARNAGYTVALIHYLPQQRPCRILCRCTAPCHPGRAAAMAPALVEPEQLGLFDMAVA
jgi:hypothetical protein